MILNQLVGSPLRRTLLAGVLFLPLVAALPVQSYDGSVATCSSSEDCDDGLFCNGYENCDNGSCVPTESPCESGQTCDEESDLCLGGGPSPGLTAYDLTGEDCVD